MSKGIFETEYLWAQAHPETPEGKSMLSLAQMYVRMPDHACLALIESAARDIRKRIKDGAK